MHSGRASQRKRQVPCTLLKADMREITWGLLVVWWGITALEFNAWLPPEIWEKEALLRLHVPFYMRRTPVSWDLFFLAVLGVPCSTQASLVAREQAL